MRQSPQQSPQQQPSSRSSSPRSASPRAPYIPKNASPLQRVQALRAAGFSLSGEELPDEEDLTGLTTRSQEPNIVVHDDDIIEHLLDPHLPPPLGRTGTVLNLVASHNESAPVQDSSGKVIVASSLSPLNRSSGSSNKLLTRSSSSGRNTPVSPLGRQPSTVKFTPSPSNAANTHATPPTPRVASSPTMASANDNNTTAEMSSIDLNQSYSSINSSSTLNTPTISDAIDLSTMSEKMVFSQQQQQQQLLNTSIDVGTNKRARGSSSSSSSPRVMSNSPSNLPSLPVNQSSSSSSLSLNDSHSLPGAAAATPPPPSFSSFSLTSPSVLFSRLWKASDTHSSTPPKSHSLDITDGKQVIQINNDNDEPKPPTPPSAQIMSLAAMIMHRDGGKKRQGFHVDNADEEDEENEGGHHGHIDNNNGQKMKIVDASEEALHVTVFGMTESAVAGSHHDLEALAVLRSSTVNHHVNKTPHWPAYMPKHIIKEDESTGRVGWGGDLPAWESLHRWLFALCTGIVLFPIRLGLMIVIVTIQVVLSFLATVAIDQFLRLMKELDILSGSDGVVRDVRYIVPEWVDATIPPDPDAPDAATSSSSTNSSTSASNVKNDPTNDLDLEKDTTASSVQPKNAFIREWGMSSKTKSTEKSNNTNATNSSTPTSSSIGGSDPEPVDPQININSSHSDNDVDPQTSQSVSSSSPSSSSNLTANQKRMAEAQEAARAAAARASENAKIAAAIAKEQAKKMLSEAMRMSSKAERRVMYYKTLNFTTYYARALWLNIPTWAEVRLLLAAPVRALLRVQLFLLGVHWVQEQGYLHPKIKPLPTPEDDIRDTLVENPRVIIANHQSFLEALYLMWRVNGSCVIDADLPNTNFLVYMMARTLGCILVDRSKPETAKAAREEIKSRAISDISLPLIVFPEGEAHYSNGSAIQNFKTPAFAPMLPVQAAAISFPHVYLDVSLTEAIGGNVNLFTLILRMMCSLYVTMEVRWIPPRGPTRTEKKDSTGVMFARGIMREVAKVLGVRSSDSALAEARLWLVSQRLHLLPQIAVAELKKTLNLSKLFLDDAAFLFRELSGRGLLQLGSTLHETDFAILMTEKDRLIGAEHLYEKYLADSKKVLNAADELANLIKTHSWAHHDHKLGTLEPQLAVATAGASDPHKQHSHLLAALGRAVKLRGAVSRAHVVNDHHHQQEQEQQVQTVSSTPTETDSSSDVAIESSLTSTPSAQPETLVDKFKSSMKSIAHKITLYWRRQYLHSLVLLGRVVRLRGRPSNVLYPSVALAVEKAEEYNKAVEKLKWIQKTRALPKQYLSRLFYALDKDGLGAVDARELIVSLSLLNERERYENNVEKLIQHDSLSLRDYSRDEYEFNSTADEARQRLLIRHRDTFMAAFAQLDETLKYDDDDTPESRRRQQQQQQQQQLAFDTASVVRINDDSGLGQLVLNHVYMRALVDPVRLARVIVTVWPKMSYERLSDLFVISAESGGLITAPDFLHWVCLPTVSCLMPLFVENVLFVGFNFADMIIRAADHDQETAEYWKEHGNDNTGEYEDLIKRLNERERIKASLRYERRIVKIGKWLRLPERPKVTKVFHFESPEEMEERLNNEALSVSAKSVKAAPGALGRSDW